VFGIKKKIENFYNADNNSAYKILLKFDS